VRKTLLAVALFAVVPAYVVADDVFTAIIGALAGSPAPAAPKLPTGAFETSKVIDVKGETKGIKLQTLAVGSDGMVYALLGSDRYGQKVPKGEIQVYDATGQKVRGWKVDFQAQTINCASDGTVYVAGDGKVATFDGAGQVKAEAKDLPFIQKVLSDAEGLKKSAEEQRASEIQSYEEIVKDFEKQLTDLQKKDEDKLTKQEKQMLKQQEAMVKSYKRMLDESKKKKAEDYINGITSRLRIINALALSDKDLYVVCGELQGYGYAVWRMDHNLENPKQVMSGLRGCCGQMDIQCCGDDLVVAQNCEHNVGRYDRDGKKLGTFGKRAGRDGNDGFGGCCNPMNVRADAAGRVYTAESEGIVRLFGKDGKEEGVLGSVKISGGCKNVAIGVSKDGNTVFFCDQPGSKIHLLTRKAESSKSSSTNSN
jgi:hypothetical protein